MTKMILPPQERYYDAVHVFDRLNDSRAWRGVMAVDGETLMLRRPVPGDKRSSFEPRAITEKDFLWAAVWLARQGMYGLTMEMVVRGMSATTEEGWSACDAVTEANWPSSWRSTKDSRCVARWPLYSLR